MKPIDHDTSKADAIKETISATIGVTLSAIVGIISIILLPESAHPLFFFIPFVLIIPALLVTCYFGCLFLAKCFEYFCKFCDRSAEIIYDKLQNRKISSYVDFAKKDKKYIGIIKQDIE